MADSTEAPVEAPAAPPAEAEAEQAEASQATQAEAHQAPEAAAESAPESKKRGRPAGSRDKAPRPPRKKQAVEAEPPSPGTPPLAPHPKGLPAPELVPQLAPQFAPREIGLHEAWETLSRHLGFHNTAQAKQEWASKLLARNFY